MSNFILYLYPHNEIYEEQSGKFYNLNGEEISFINGLVTCPETNDEDNIENIFKALKNNKRILGDFQALNLKKNGNDHFITSPSSIYPLFYYEDEFCSILSNELKLIVDGLKIFKDNKFINFYNYNYIKEIFYYGDYYKGEEKTILRSTIFENIKRILPQDEVIIRKNNIIIKENEDIDIPKWFEEWYLEDKDSLFDWYYEELINYTTSLIKNIGNNLKEVVVPITGGYDSRLALTIFSIIKKKFDFALYSRTSGPESHPDVVIGQKVANSLNVEWENIIPKDNLKVLPQNFNDYIATFYQAQGDWNSYDFFTNYSREVNDSHTLYQLGMDMYKRKKVIETVNFNRWFGRRKLCRSNIYFPLFSTCYELWFSKLYNKDYNENDYTEFIYNILKRGSPNLLEIPFAFKSLPQTDTEEYKAENYISTEHKVTTFLWDYTFVYDAMNPVFKEIFLKYDTENNSILSKTGLNSLDYFLLMDDIKILLSKNYEDEKLKEKLKKLKNNSYYPLYRSNIDLNKKNNFKLRGLLQLMDYAAAANFNSFENIEKSCSFNKNMMEDNELSRLEIQYKKIGEIKEEYYKLLNNYELLKNENNKNKKELDKIKKENQKIFSSKSWKITKPLRILMNKIRR